MSDISDWDAVPVKASANKAQASSGSNTADWDAVPIKAASSSQASAPITGSAGAQQKQRIMANAEQMRKDVVGGNVAAPGLGVIEGIGNVVTGMGSSIVGGLAGGARTLYNLAAGEGIDKSTELGAQTVRAVQDAGTYQPRTAGGQLVSELASAPINAVKAMSSSIGGDVGQAVNGQQGRIAGEAIGDVAPDIAGAVIGGRAALARPAPVLLPMPELLAAPVVSNVPAYIRKAQADFQNAKTAGQPVAKPVTPAGTMQTPPAAAVAAPVEAAMASGVPASNTQAGAVGASKTPNYAAAESLAPDESPASVGKPLPPQDQSARAAVLQRIGLTEARKSAINGDAMTGATQAQMANFNEAAGRAAKDLFDSERAALEAHAQNIVRDTGGKLGTDERTLNARGQAIAAPFDGLRTYFDGATKELYKAADEKSGGLPSTNLEDFGKLINTESQFAGKAENGSLGSGIRSYLREQNIMDKDGGMTPITPQQAEGIKQYINSQWSPGTSGLAGKIKSAIDKDVFKGAGADVYAQARDLYKLKKQTLENPNGVAKLMDFDPQTPINRTTPYNRLPDTLTNLSPDQFKHVVDTLKNNMPEALHPQAQAALSEIKGHMANSLLDVGNKFESRWNAKGVTGELLNNSAKYPMVFDAAELARISDLNDAGHILSVNKSYPGAAAQAANSMKQGMMPHLVGSLTNAAGSAAGSILGPAGAAAGSFLGRVAGNKASAAMGESAALKKFNKGTVKLSEFPK